MTSDIMPMTVNKECNSSLVQLWLWQGAEREPFPCRGKYHSAAVSYQTLFALFPLQQAEICETRRLWRDKAKGCCGA